MRDYPRQARELRLRRVSRFGQSSGRSPLRHRGRWQAHDDKLTFNCCVVAPF